MTRLLFDVTRLMPARSLLAALPFRRGTAPSGLRRVGHRLLDALQASTPRARVPEAPEVVPVRWQPGALRSGHGAMRSLDGAPVTVTASDVFFTPELMSPAERPGFDAFLQAFPGRRLALFHDAIPILHPQYAWPKAAARHPAYMALLGDFDHVACVSAAAKADLLDWRRRLAHPPRPTSVLPLGADLTAHRVTGVRRHTAPHALVALGIVEPRKGQDLLLDAMELLGRDACDGSGCHLTMFGRVNPHYGKPIATRAKHASVPVTHLTSADDERVLRGFADATLSVFASRAEGLGLPILESLWLGVPCVASDIAPHRESAAGGGCALFRAGDSADLAATLRRLLNDPGERDALAQAAVTRALPTWAACADALRQIMATTKRL